MINSSDHQLEWKPKLARDRANKSPYKIREAEYYRAGCIAFNLRRATRIVTRRYEEALRPLGMKAFQFTALAALTEYDTLPQLAFADLFGMDVSTVNRNTRAMERKGWITYTDDPQDGRKKHVAITKEGRRVFAEAAPLWEKAQAETRALMTGYDWDQERTWLEALSRESNADDGSA